MFLKAMLPLSLRKLCPEILNASHTLTALLVELVKALRYRTQFKATAYLAKKKKQITFRAHVSRAVLRKAEVH